MVDFMFAPARWNGVRMRKLVATDKYGRDGSPTVLLGLQPRLASGHPRGISRFLQLCRSACLRGLPKGQSAPLQSCK